MKIKTILSIVTFFYTVQSFAITNEAQCALNGVDYKQALVFVQALQKAVGINDKKAVAQLAIFPLRVNTIGLNGKVETQYIKNQAELINKYDRLFSEKLKQNLAEVKPTDVFCNWQGAMIASIWFQTDMDTTAGFFVINR